MGGKCEDEAIAAQSHLSRRRLALPEADESEAPANAERTREIKLQLHYERLSDQTAGQPARSRSCISPSLPTRLKGHQICDSQPACSSNHLEDGLSSISTRGIQPVENRKYPPLSRTCGRHDGSGTPDSQELAIISVLGTAADCQRESHVSCPSHPAQHGSGDEYR